MATENSKSKTPSTCRHVVLWTVAQRHYAIDTARVVEVVPVVQSQPVPRWQAWALGIINYRGTLIPLLDMPRLLGFDAWEPRLTSRILIVAKEDARDQEDSRLGLLVETVLGSEILAFPRPTMLPEDGAAEDTFLGPIALTTQGTVQWIETSHIPSPTVVVKH